ncbi:MAG TPA: hypothetical protein VH723_00455 [Candidatus Limnocylindrales bacterium]|jgi:hypothetical protein
MKRTARRVAVTLGVAVSIIAGAVAIQLAAMYTAAAAPPKAPPISMEALRAQLADEQTRSAELQAQLDELADLTGQLAGALDSTQAELSSDGLTAAELRRRLAAAQSKLAAMTRQLKQAQDRLLALQKALADAGKAPPPTSAPPTPAPPPGGMTLSLARTGGVVTVDWTSCATGSFAGYAVVRSTDVEVKWPPEDGDTEIVRVTNRATTVFEDAAAPSGTLRYAVFCLYRHESELKVATRTPTRSITVP